MKLHNLKLKDSRYVPLGVPAHLADISDASVIGSFQPQNGIRITLFLNGPSLAYTINNGEKCLLCDIDIADGFSVEVSERGYIIRSSRYIYDISCDEAGIPMVNQYPIQHPVARIIAPAAGTVTLQAPIPSCQLAESYSSNSGTLGLRDAKSFNNALTDAYCNIADNAASDGLFAAPVFLRYRYIMQDGAPAIPNAVSEPLLMTPPGGVKPLSAQTILDAKATRPGLLPVNLFRCSLHLSPDQISILRDAGITGVAVDATHQIHPLDPRRTEYPRIHGTEGALYITAYLPGSASTSLQYNMAMRILDTDINPGIPQQTPFVQVAQHFFSDDDALNGISMPIPPRNTPIQQVLKYLHSLPDVGSNLIPDTMDDYLCSGSQISAGQSLQYGIKRVLPAPPDPRLYAIHADSRLDPSGRCAVTFSANGIRRNTIAPTGGNLVRWGLGPMVSIRGRHSGTLNVLSLDDDDNCYRAHVQLRPIGCHSVYIDPKLMDISSHAGGQFLFLPEQGHIADAPGLVITRNSNGALIDILPTSIGNIVAILPTPSATASAYDISRRRFIAFSSQGIFALSVDTQGKLKPPVCLDSRCVDNPSAVVRGEDAHGNPALYAIAGGDLVKCSASAVSTLGRSIGHSMLAWDPAQAQLLMLSPGSATARIYHKDPAIDYTRSVPPVRDVHCRHGIAWIASTDGYYDLASPIPSPMRCILSTDINMPARHPWRGLRPIRNVCIDMISTHAEGSLTVAAAHSSGDHDPLTLSRLSFAGPVRRPLSHRVLLPPRAYLKVTLDALLSPSSNLKLPYCHD